MAATTTIGSKFKNICFIGLNRVEYFPEKANESILADSWQDVTDEHSRKNLALIFFSPRDLDGNPMNPYIFLSEHAEGGTKPEMQASSTDEEDSSEGYDPSLGNELSDIPLIDLCRVPKAPANTVFIIAVSDVLFHWDMTDSYIQPTSASTWVRDVKQIQSMYPRTTQYRVYTSWKADKLSELKMETAPLRELPLEPTTWINMPTFQEKYGLPVLLSALLLAGGAYAGIHMQSSEIETLNAQIAEVEQSIPQNNNQMELAAKFSEQEAQMRYRHLMPLIVKDIANAIRKSNMKAESFDVRNLKPQEAPTQLVTTISAKKDVYKGWLQEESIAKTLLANSYSIVAIRKPPSRKTLTLEGLIELDPLAVALKSYTDRAQAQQSEEDSLPEGVAEFLSPGIATGSQSSNNPDGNSDNNAGTSPEKAPQP